MNVNPEVAEEVNKYLRVVRFNRKFRTFVKHEVSVPKILGDIWEAIVYILYLS